MKSEPGDNDFRENCLTDKVNMVLIARRLTYFVLRTYFQIRYDSLPSLLSLH